MMRIEMSLCRFGLQPAKTRNVGSDRDGRGSTEGVASAGHDLTTGSAFPDAGTLSLDVVLAAKDASVGRVLRDFNLAQQLSQRRTVSGSVLARDSDLLGALSHCKVLVLLVGNGFLSGD